MKQRIRLAALPRAAVVTAALTVALTTVVTPAFAHHGWSDYDADQPVTLTGRIAQSSYENPHATITLDASGKRYTVVLAPVSRMEARGASRESVATGHDITVTGFPSKTHAGEIRAERIVVGDGAAGKTVELR